MDSGRPLHPSPATPHFGHHKKLQGPVVTPVRGRGLRPQPLSCTGAQGAESHPSRAGVEAGLWGTWPDSLSCWVPTSGAMSEGRMADPQSGPWAGLQAGPSNLARSRGSRSISVLETPAFLGSVGLSVSRTSALLSLQVVFFPSAASLPRPPSP